MTVSISLFSQAAWPLLLLALALLAPSPRVLAADLRISLPQLPPMVESRTKGPLVKLAQAIAREWNEGKVTIIGPSPFEESVANVVEGRADVHFPLIASPARSDEDLPFRYSSITLYDTPFALYARKDNPRVDRKQLTIAALSKLRIETDRAHIPLFFFRLREADSVAGALQRVDSGQIDGFLFSVSATEPVLKRLRLTSIDRTPYRRFASKMVLPKGPRGDELDDKLGLIIDRLKDSGEYQRIMGATLPSESSP